MKKLAIISTLLASLLVAMSAQAGHRHHDDDRHWGKKHHHSHKFKKHRQFSQHRPHGKRFKRVLYDVYPSHRVYRHKHYRRHHDDGGNWGIVFHFFD